MNATCTECGLPLPAGFDNRLCAQCLLSFGLGASFSNSAAEPDLTDLLSSPMPGLGVQLHHFGDYELIEEIARGGMGVIFRARQVSLNRVVALKVIQSALGSSHEAVRRFQLEAEAVARLDHPNIVPVYEVGQHEGHHYFSMKLVEGGALSRRIAANPTGLPPREAATLLLLIARAVHYAHQRGILHRDLKPGNILLDSNAAPHVSDFGLARLIDDDSRLTLPGVVLGTPSYMSPEQAAGRDAGITTASDVWSLGVILYELLTGCPPFTGKTPMEVLHQVLEADPTPPRRRWESGKPNRQDTDTPAAAASSPGRSGTRPGGPIDAALETICLKCLEKEPSRRYESAAALADELDRWLRHEPIHALPSSFVDRLSKWRRRQPVLAASVLLLLAVFCVGLGGITWQWRRAERNATREADQRLRAERAEVDALRRLSEAKLNFVKANRRSSRPGQQFESLDVLRRDMGGTNTLELRNEAIAALCTPDSRPVKQWATKPAAHNFGAGANLQRYRTNDPAGHLAIRDALTGKTIQVVTTEYARLKLVIASPDDRFLATVDRDGTAVVWDLSRNPPIPAHVPGPAASQLLAFTPDGSQIAVRRPGGTIDLVASTNGLPVRSIRIPRTILGLIFAPSGKQFLTLDGREVFIWDLPDGRLVRRLAPPVDGAQFSTAAWSPDGRRVALSWLGQIGIWDVGTGRQLGALAGHDGIVVTMGFTETGEYLVSGSWDNTTRLWRVESRREVLRIPESGNGLHFNSEPGQLRLVTWTGAEVHLHELAIPRAVERFNLPLSERSLLRYTAKAVFSPDGEWIAALDKDGAHLFHPPDPTPLAFMPAPESYAVWFAPDGSLFTGSSDGLRRWPATRTKAGEPLSFGPPQVLPPTRGREIADFCLSGDARWAIAVDAEGFIAFPLHGEARGVRPKPEVRRGGYPRLAPDGSIAASLATSDRNRLQVWNPRDGNLITNLPVAPVDDFCFSGDGRLLASTASDSTCVWRTSDWSRLHELRHPPTETARHRVAFSPDGTVLAMVPGDRAIRLVDVGTGEELASLPTEGNMVNSMEFDASGSRLLAAHEQGFFEIWHLDRLRDRLAEMNLDWSGPRLKPQSPPAPARKGSATVLTDSVEVSESDMVAVRKRAIQLLNSNQPALAIHELSRLLAWRPADIDALLDRARAFEKLGDATRASSDLRDAFRRARLRDGQEVALQPSATVEFDNPPTEHGLQWRRNDVGGAALDRVDGVDCLRAQVVDGTVGCLYFSVDPAHKSDAPMTLQVEVDYLDAAGGLLGVEYDASTPGSPPATAYSPSLEAASLNGSGTWKTARFELLDARFRNSQNAGADFRLVCTAHRFYVRRVALVPLVSPK